MDSFPAIITLATGRAWIRSGTRSCSNALGRPERRGKYGRTDGVRLGWQKLEAARTAMIIVDTALRKREAEGRPIKVGMIGAGFQGKAIAFQIIRATPGMQLCAIASRRIETAISAFAQTDRMPITCGSQSALEAAIAAGQPAVTDDALTLARADGLDAVIEVTGSVEYAAQAVLAAIKSGKHVVQMNAELDGTIGPILKVRADRAG